jgi:3-deoxy-D-manno-octulosonic-acid transferase
MIARFYQVLSYLVLPIVILLIHRRLKIGKEDPKRYFERYGISNIKRPNKKLVWIHAASIGEAQSALALIEKLNTHPKKPAILVTTGTVTSSYIMAKRLPKGAIHQFIPYDIDIWIRRFYDHWQPDLMLWVESELWPNMLHQAHYRNIPVIMINGRLSAKTQQRWQFFKPMIASMLNCFNHFYVQSNDHAQALINLGANPDKISAVGNLKFAASPLPVDKFSFKKLSDQLKDRPVWAAMSTHKGEEEMVLKAHQKIKAMLPSALCILVPRHTERIPEILTLIPPLTFALRSKNKAITNEIDILLADTIGESGLFYALSSIAFVGGSLAPVGGHNIIEAAQLDCAIVHGPYMHKSMELLLPFKEKNATIEVLNTSELAEKVLFYLQNKDKCQKITALEKKIVDSHAHVIEDVYQRLEKYLA